MCAQRTLPCCSQNVLNLLVSLHGAGLLRKLRVAHDGTVGAAGALSGMLAMMSIWNASASQS